MLLPKRVKYRRVQRGRLTGKALRGNTISNGEYGLQALELSLIHILRYKMWWDKKKVKKVRKIGQKSLQMGVMYGTLILA